VHIAASNTFERRLVLFPQGQPEDAEDRCYCAQYAFWCGGDVSRFIDAPTDSIEKFASHVGRISAIYGDQTLVVLTRTCPLAEIVNLRSRLEASIPKLRGARWLIYLDTNADPLFERMAMRLGHLTGKLSDAPVWFGPHDTHYLVVESRTSERQVVHESLLELDQMVRSRQLPMPTEAAVMAER
jgi:hypothetical protein